MRVELHIERLVLDGVGLDPRHAGALREAVVAELARRLGGHDGWSPARLHTVTAGPAHLPAPTDPGDTGRAIAVALHAGVTPTGAGRGTTAGRG